MEGFFPKTAAKLLKYIERAPIRADVLQHTQRVLALPKVLCGVITDTQSACTGNWNFLSKSVSQPFETWDWRKRKGKRKNEN